MPDSFDEFKQSKEYAKKHTSAQSEVSIEPQPTDADRRIIIDAIAVGGDTAGTIQFLDHDGNAIDGYFWTYGANGGVALANYFLRKLDKNKGLKYTQTGGGNWSIVVKYHLEEGNYA